MSNNECNIKVSVVVPIYNAELFLHECIDSILSQSLTEFELICVDDGSIDNSVSIIEKYISLDKRVILLKQNHKFAGEARNKGLSIAKGKYIIFLDADDFFNNKMLEDLYIKAEQTSADIVLFGGARYDNQKKTYTIEKSWLKTAGIENTEVFSRVDYPMGYLLITNPAPWTKFFNRGFILEKDIRFQGLHNANDLYFTMLAMSCADRVTYIDQCYVNYRININTNIQNTKKNHPLDFYTALRKLYEGLNIRGLYKDVENSYLRLATSVIVYNLNTVDKDTEKIIVEKISDDIFINNTILFNTLDDPNSVTIRQRINANKYEKRIKDNEPSDYVEISGNAEAPICSVIIPVYNTVKNLDACLNSIRKQTQENIEIICVNDGSTDGSIELLRNHARDDKRITLISQKNGGLSRARNTGIKYASGKYIYFIDSDDILHPDAIDILTNRMLNDKLDILFFDSDTFFDEEVKDDEKHSLYYPNYLRKHDYRDIKTGITLAEEMIKNNEFYVSACLQINRTQFLKNIGNTFEPGILYEDNLFTFKSILKANRVGYESQAFYKRRIRKNSIMTSKHSFLNCYSYFLCYMLMMKELYSYADSDNFPEEILNIPNKVLESSRDIYMHLPKEEQLGDHLDGLKKSVFCKEITDYCENCNITRQQSDETHFYKMLYEDVIKSVSFKIGRYLTLIPRSIRNAITRRS